MLLHLSLVAVLASLTAADSKNERITPSRGALVVDASGKLQNSFRNISAAVIALNNTTSPQTIYVAPGTYAEQVYIPPLAGPLTVQGYTKDARSYKDNKVTITGNLSRQTPGLANNDATATVRLWTSNVKLYNLNIANTFGQAATGGQALALSAQKTNQGFYGCSFTGYQDTIYANEGRQLYAESFINGMPTASILSNEALIPHRGRGFHFRFARVRLVRQSRHRDDWIRIHHSKRTRYGEQHQHLCLQPGGCSRHKWRKFDIPGPSLAAVESRDLPEELLGRCGAPGRLVQVGCGTACGQCGIQRVQELWAWRGWTESEF